MKSYESMTCPLPGCGGELWVERTECIPVFVDSEPGEFKPGSGYTSSWKVICDKGHVILVPTRHADDCEEFAQPCGACEDSCEEHDDLADLHSLIARVRGGLS